MNSLAFIAAVIRSISCSTCWPSLKQGRTIVTYGASPRGPAAVPSGCAAGGTNGCGDSRWTGAGTASCDADGPCGTTWVGAERDGWAAGRGFVNGSFISTASLPATGRAAAHDASGRGRSAHRGDPHLQRQADRVVRSALQQPGVLTHEHVGHLHRVTDAHTGPGRQAQRRRRVGGEQHQPPAVARDGLRDRADRGRATRRRPDAPRT